MIYLKYDNFQNSNVISKQEKIIGAEGSNKIDSRIFNLPKLFKETDLSEPEFIFFLQVQPVEKTEAPYFQILEKTILENSIELKWIINNVNTSTGGDLGVSIKAQKEEGNIVWESNILTFTVLKGISAVEGVKEILPNIFEQYIIQAANHAERAIEAANLVYEIVQDFEDKWSEKIEELVSKFDLIDEIYGEIDSIKEMIENFVGTEDTGIEMIPPPVTPEAIGAVPITRRINDYTLDEDVNLSAHDVDAVPIDRKINDKELSEDIDLDASDVGSATSYTYDILLSTEWEGSKEPYTQVVPISGILSTDEPHANIIQSDDWNESVMQREEWDKIVRAVTSDGFVEFYAAEKTTIELEIRLSGVR